MKSVTFGVRQNCLNTSLPRLASLATANTFTMPQATRLANLHPDSDSLVMPGRAKHSKQIAETHGERQNGQTRSLPKNPVQVSTVDLGDAVSVEWCQISMICHAARAATTMFIVFSYRRVLGQRQQEAGTQVPAQCCLGEPLHRQQSENTSTTVRLSNQFDPLLSSVEGGDHEFSFTRSEGGWPSPATSSSSGLPVSVGY